MWQYLKLIGRAFQDQVYVESGAIKRTIYRDAIHLWETRAGLRATYGKTAPLSS